MSFYVVDVEADGKSPLTSSMVSFGAVKVTDKLDQTFYGETAPINDFYIPEALAVSEIDRKTHEGFDDPETVMNEFAKWVNFTKKGNATFVSDNNGFDWMWICCYFDLYGIDNPFGFSSRRIGDIYCGYKKHSGKNREWKKLRKTKHTHNPVDDAKGNAEALLVFRDQLGITFNFD